MFKALADFDRRYAGRVLQDLGGAGKAPLREAFTALPFADYASYRSPDRAENTLMGKIGEEVTIAGAMALNAGYRYGLPAAGVTLAGKALLDLTGAYETQTNGTIMP